MLPLIIEQLTLFGSLCAVVLAVLWPHVRPLLSELYKQYRTLFDNHEHSQELKHTSYNVQEHPRLNGYTLNRRSVSI